MNSERDMTAEPMFINVDINGKNVKMEIDTGTYFAVMSESVVNSKFKNVKLSRSTTRLVGYENNAMRPLGELKNLKVTLHGKTKLPELPSPEKRQSTTDWTSVAPRLAHGH